MTPNNALSKNLRRLEKVMPAGTSTVIYRGEDFPIAGGGEYINFKNLVSRLDSLAPDGTVS